MSWNIHIIANRNFSSMWRGANTTLELLLGAGQTPLSMVKDQDLSPQWVRAYSLGSFTVAPIHSLKTDSIHSIPLAGSIHGFSSADLIHGLSWADSIHDLSWADSFHRSSCWLRLYYTIACTFHEYNLPIIANISIKQVIHLVACLTKHLKQTLQYKYTESPLPNS